MSGHSAFVIGGLLTWTSLLCLLGASVIPWVRPLGWKLVMLNVLGTVMVMAATLFVARFAIYRAENACQTHNPINRLVTIDRQLDLVHNHVTCRYLAADGQRASAAVTFAELFG